MTHGEGRYPRPTPVTAYGGGGFRFADMSHRGSILCLPSGVHAWDVVCFEDVSVESLQRPLAELTLRGVLLLGTGETQAWPDEAIVRAFANAGVGLEIMSTGAAARTYNVLLAEGRNVGAALIAVS
ncbi:MAG: Mth938-like domain-containing protein [Hyphomicrobium sp.]